MISILLTGAAGQLGSAIQAYAKAHEIQLHAFSKQVLDITKPASIQDIFQKFHPQFLINTAAYTAVDLAETEKEEAFQKNAYAAEYLAKACRDFDCVMLHLSTDYVFDGNLDHPYRETDSAKPLGCYGQTKLLGEQLVQEACEKHFILRVSWVFSEYGKNFVKTILSLAAVQKTLKIVNDQTGCPTNTAHIAAVIFRVINQLKNTSNGWGIYHYCDQPAATWYDFACTIISEAKKFFPLQVEEILPISSEEFPTPVKRPMNSNLDCSKIEKAFHIQRFNWQSDLSCLIRNIYANQSIST